MLDYLVSQFQGGRLNERARLRLHTADEMVEHYAEPFISSFCAWVGGFYRDSVKAGRLKLRLDMETRAVGAFASYGEVRFGE